MLLKFKVYSGNFGFDDFGKGLAICVEPLSRSDGLPFFFKRKESESRQLIFGLPFSGALVENTDEQRSHEIPLELAGLAVDVDLIGRPLLEYDTVTESQGVSDCLGSRVCLAL